MAQNEVAIPFPERIERVEAVEPADARDQDPGGSPNSQRVQGGGEGEDVPRNDQERTARDCGTGERSRPPDEEHEDQADGTK